MKSLFVLIFFLITISALAQNRTNIWELGYSINNYPRCELHYQNSIMDTTGVVRVMTFFNTNSSICDTSGNLLFYSNGLTIGNRNYDTLQNAVNFNPGWATDLNEPDGMSNCQGVIFLTDPGNDQRYYVFHETGEPFYAHGDNQVQPLHLSYSVIDLNLDGGFGGIVDTLKNKYAIVDTLMWGGLTAVKHANGRDWWVVAHQFWSDKYYKLLLTPDGLLGPYEQHIGSDSIIFDADVQATFSPDGSKYCLSDYSGWFDYMNFDRCTGEFYNAITIYNPDSLDHYFFGSSFSPNSRFIYASSKKNLFQYDTWNINMVEDVIHVATWDSFYSEEWNIAVLFFLHQLAPDGRIYIGPFNGVQYLNVINSPDSLGLDCYITPHSVLITHDCFTNVPPSFPNYDLGALEGSPCDTLYLATSSGSPPKISLRIYPNPAADWLNIVYQTNEDAFFELFDINGKRVTAGSLYHYFRNRLFDVSRLSAGVYLASMKQKGKEVWSEKVVVQHD